MSLLPRVRLKKGEEKRAKAFYPWIYSNEIDVGVTPLKAFTPGDEVIVESSGGYYLGNAIINPHSLIAARIFAYEETSRLSLAFFKEKIAAALAYRDSLFVEPYYRLVFAESDGLPGVIIDRFAMHFVVQINVQGMERVRQLIVDALVALFPAVESITLRADSNSRAQEGLSAYVETVFGVAPAEYSVNENDCAFVIPAKEGQKTGWFYDHRANRARLKHYVADKRVLDVCSYMGAFAIPAARFGATSVDCIDASALAARYIAKNAELNNVSDRVSVHQGDAFDTMQQWIKEKRQFDVIVLDPPAFAKKKNDIKKASIAYQRLNELALSLLAPNGVLMSCSCSMHIPMTELIHIVRRAAIRSRRSLQIIERGYQAEDHPVHLLLPETDYLKAIILRSPA